MVNDSMDWPAWWRWELDVGSPHLAKRMKDRQFNETDLRQMLELATGLAPNHEPGRWIVQTTWHNTSWEVIIEPLPDEQLLLVITAYPIQ